MSPKMDQPSQQMMEWFLAGTDEPMTFEQAVDAAHAIVADPTFNRDVRARIRVRARRIRLRDLLDGLLEARAAVRAELAAELFRKRPGDVGAVANAKTVVDEAYSVAVAHIRAVIGAAPPEVLSDLIELQGQWGSLYPESDDHGPSYESAITEHNRAMRWLIEVCCHEPPRGRTQLATPVMRRLVCLAAEALHLRVLSDASWKGLAHLEVDVVDGELVATGTGAYPVATWEQAVGFGQKGLAAYHKRQRELARAVAGAEWNEVQAAFEVENGFRLDDVYSTVRDLALAAAVGVGGAFTASANEHELVSLAARRRTIGRSAARELVRSLVLRPSDRFDPLHFEFEPQRHLRAHSYVMRPLVRGGSRVVFGAFHLSAWPAYHERLILDDRLPLVPGRLRSSVGLLAQRLASHFAEAIAILVRQAPGWQALANVWHLGDLDLRRAGLGDIDVLAVHAESSTVVAIEAKRMAPGLTPYDAWQEREQFHGGRKRHVAKHQRRVEHLAVDPGAIEAEFGQSSSPWKILGCIVTTAPMAGAKLVESGLPVLWEPQLAEWLEAQAAGS
jgi:hypothetical protein